MNKRILTIDNCNDCPYFDNHYFSYNEICRKLDRIIQKDRNRSAITPLYPIPDDCPLEKCVDKQ
jgi:hypothetical protein